MCCASNILHRLQRNSETSWTFEIEFNRCLHTFLFFITLNISLKSLSIHIKMPFNLISFVCYWQHLWTSLFCTSFFSSIFPDVANQRRIWHDKLCTMWLKCLINFSVELFTLTFKLGRSNGISALFEGTTISSETKCVCEMHEVKGIVGWALPFLQPKKLPKKLLESRSSFLLSTMLFIDLNYQLVSNVRFESLPSVTIHTFM